MYGHYFEQNNVFFYVKYGKLYVPEKWKILVFVWLDNQ